MYASDKFKLLTGSRFPIKRFAPTSKLFLSWDAFNKEIIKHENPYQSRQNQTETSRKGHITSLV